MVELQVRRAQALEQFEVAGFTEKFVDAFGDFWADFFGELQVLVTGSSR